MQQIMMVAEDRLRLASPSHLMCLNRQFVAYIQQQNRNIIRIKHLYLLIADITLTYQLNITHICSSAEGYLCIANELNQVEVLYLTFGQKIEVKTILAVKKPACLSVGMNGNMLVVMVGSGRVDVAQFEEGNCVFKGKYDTKVEFAKIAVGGNAVYLMEQEGVVRRVGKVAGKFSETGRYQMGGKAKVVGMQVLEAQGEQYLIVQQEGSLSLISANTWACLTTVTYKGTFKEALLDRNILTVITEQPKAEMLEFHLINPAMFELPSAVQPVLLAKTHCINTRLSKRHWVVATDQPEAYLKRQKQQAILQNTVVGTNSEILIYSLGEDNMRLELSRISAKHLLKQKQPSPITNLRVQLGVSILASLQRLVQSKLTTLTCRLDSLQTRIGQLQKSLTQKLNQQSLRKAYCSALKLQLAAIVQNKLLPKMQSGFKQIMSQLSKIMHQGIEYFNEKLQIEAELQKKHFATLMSNTLETSQRIIELGKNQLMSAVKTQQYLEAMVNLKEQIVRRTNTLLEEVKKGPFGLPLVEFEEVVNGRFLR